MGDRDTMHPTAKRRRSPKSTGQGVDFRPEAARAQGARSQIVLSASPRLHGFLDLLLDSLEVEARALLHRRKLDRGLGEFPDLLLYKHETPELDREPVVIRQ